MCIVYVCMHSITILISLIYTYTLYIRTFLYTHYTHYTLTIYTHYYTLLLQENPLYVH